jgi:ethanolamine utilization microcompartment shell protein EutS
MVTMRALVVVVALLGGAACGGGDDAADDSDAGDSTAGTTQPDAGEGDDAAVDSPLVAAIADSIMVDVDGGDGPVADRAEAECWASGIVDGVGEDRLTELGVTAESAGQIGDLGFTESEIATVVDSLFGCSDIRQTFVDQFTGELGQEAAACVGDAIDEELVKDLLAASIAGQDSAAGADTIQQLTQLATECGITS